MDTNFFAGTDGPVYSLAVQEDGKIIVGGWFSAMNGDWRDFLGRLNPDGTLDTGFNPVANSTVYCLAQQVDGKILVGGNFTTLGGQTHNRLARLNPDGSVDASFNPNADETIYCLAVQPDGKIIVGGLFTTLNGLSRNYLGRLNSDGSTDPTFNPNAGNVVYTLAVQPNGRMVVGGWFAEMGGQFRTNIARTYPDGTLDLTFYGAANGYVKSLSLQANGKILAGGSFTTLSYGYNGIATSMYSFARLGSTGSCDIYRYFSGGYSGPVFGTAIQDDGRLLAGGYFTSPRTYAARWSNNEAATQSLVFDGSTILWLRGGSSPEVWRTTFDISTNGSDWIAVGAGTRTNGGWKLAGLAAPASATIRARGWVSGGGSSSWVVETLTGPPVITSNPTSRTNNAGTTATFTVKASGLVPLGYQWLKDGAPLSNGGNVSGANTATLTLSNVLAADAGWFSAVVTNAYGSVTSSAASLSVVVALTITSQPADRTNAIGSTTTFAVQVTGPGPITYQWKKNGVNLTDGGAIFGAATATLTVTTTSGADAGGYSVTMSNDYGSVGVVTSRTAILTVLDPVITTQPASRANNAGTLASFTVQTRATLPCGCRWIKNGLPLGEPTYYSGSMPSTLTLTLTNVLGADAGGYAFVISNAYGCVTSTVAVLTVADPFITAQPVGQVVGPGAGPSFSLTASGTASLGYQWRKDGASLAGATSASLSLTNVQAQAVGYYDVIVSNAFGCLTSTPALLTVNLATQASCFSCPIQYGWWASWVGRASALALQVDGKVLLGGQRYTLSGDGYVRYTNMWFSRFQPNGVLEPFDRVQAWVGGASETVTAAAIQSDGNILFGGSFTNLSTDSANPRNCLARITPDGNLDPSYDPGFTSASTNAASVNCLLVQADGKVLVGGSFSTVAGQPRYNLCRLASDGTLDRGFFPGANGTVNSLVVQPDGGIVVGGSFTTLRDQARNRIGRLYADGTLDPSFAPGVSGTVSVLGLQADGKILVGGSFTTLAGQPRANIGRLNSDGTLDLTFNPGANGTVRSLATLANGMILVCGDFTILGGQARGVGRFKADGSLDNTITGDGPTYAMAVQADGRFWVGGGWVCLWTMPEPATQSLSFNGTTATWLRGGIGPEVWRTGFETSTDGTNWVELGAGARVAGGWQLAVPSGLATNSLLRARGWTTGGQYNGSSWFVETVASVNPQTAPQVRVPAAGGLGTNGFTFTITGLAGQVVVVEAATELVPPSLSGTVPPVGSLPIGSSSENWTPIATNTLGFGPLYFSDPGAVSMPWRFYRARLQ